MLYLRPQDQLRLCRIGIQSAKRKGAGKEPWLTAAFKGWAQEEWLAMEPGMEQSERKEENKEGRFLLGSGVKFYEYLDGICPQYLGMFKSFTAN